MESMQEFRSWAEGQTELPVTRLELPDPPPTLSAEEIKNIRSGAKMSQGLFSRYLGVSTKTLQSWEQGVRRPSASALRLMQIIRTHPEVLLELHFQAAE